MIQYTARPQRDRGRVSSCASQWGSILVLLLALGPSAAQGQQTNSTQTTYARTPTVLGKVEGCFNEFAYLLSVDFANEILSNAKCQAFCGDHAFAVSGTFGRICGCGNIYPNVNHRVDQAHCDEPCSLDQLECKDSGCCGSGDGVHFTIAFAGEPDIRKSLLRQLMSDFRTQAGVYRAYVKDLLSEATLLQAVPPSAASTTMAGGTTAQGADNATQPLGYVGLSGGCPAGWKTLGGSCFTRVTVGPSHNYDQGQSACQIDGATLAVLSSLPGAPSESKTLAALASQGTRQGAAWIGLSVKSGPLGPFWSWDVSTNWAGSQPDESSSGSQIPAYGVAKGAVFDEYSPNNQAVAKITIGYSISAILSIKTAYRRKDGSVVDSQERGAAGGGGKSSATITLSLGEWITQVSGTVGPNGLMSLALTTTNSTGQQTKYGPYGRSSGGTVFLYNAGADVTALHGRTDGTVITQLGFYEYRGRRCSIINDLGQLETIFCDQIYQEPFYVCERPHTTNLLECPSPWRNAGDTCMRGFRSTEALSWLGARAACLAQQGRLAQLDSQSRTALAWSLIDHAVGFVGLRDYSPSSLYRVYGWDRFDSYADGQPKLMARDAAAAATATASVIGTGESGVSSTPPTCVAMQASDGGKWSTANCSTVMDKVRVVCEMEPSTSNCTCPAGYEAFLCLCYRTAPSVSSSSWLQADAYCRGLTPPARLPRVPHKEANDKVRALAAGASTFIGRADRLGNGYLTEDTNVAWGDGRQPRPVVGDCAIVRSDGNWYSTPCVSGVTASLCSTPKAPHAAFLGEQGGQSFSVVEVPGQELEWGRPFHIQIINDDTKDYLAVDEAGHVYSVTPEAATPSLTTFTLNFIKAADGSTTGGPKSTNTPFTVMHSQLKHYLLLDQASNRLVTAASPNSQLDPVGNGFATAFMASHAVAPLALRRLQMSIASQGAANETLRHCTAFVYDLTPHTDSYSCYEVPSRGPDTSLPIVGMNLQAWIIQDKTGVLYPRVPLENARMECENSDAIQSLACSLIVGAAQVYTSSVSIQHGYTISNQFEIHQIAGANTPGGYYNFDSIFSNAYTAVTQVAYTATDMRTTTVPVPPLTTTVIQYWQATVQASYAWQSIFAAQGSFQMSSLGVALGDARALSTLSSNDDLFFFVWGRRSYPSLSQIISTVNLAEYGSFPFDRPPINNVGGRRLHDNTTVSM